MTKQRRGRARHVRSNQTGEQTAEDRGENDRAFIVMKGRA